MALSVGDVRSSPVPGRVPATVTEHGTLVFIWKLVLYEPSMVGSGLEGGYTVTLHDVVDEHFFDSDLVVLSASVSDNFDNIVEVKNPKKNPQ